MKVQQVNSSSTYLMTSPHGNISIQGIRKNNGDYTFVFYDEHPGTLSEFLFDHRPVREKIFCLLEEMQESIDDWSCEETKKAVRHFLKYIKKHKGNILQKLHKVINDIKYSYEKSSYFVINKNTVSFIIR